ncbi:MAG: hypothetical protein CBC38_02355 [Gammaproteobacteria bacterium TMED78]|nr:MAG: hypothetical protein CBC38_02355 [Gammaproteobacteria bacterium TMED78]|tara:strand:- start:160632 stop:162581 length:1950 start_codon:yes stop_codon:yes gene_type:complete
MKSKKKKNTLGRREFLAGAAVTSITAPFIENDANSQQPNTLEKPSAPLPNSTQSAMEQENPDNYTKEQRAGYFIDNPGSDFMTDVVKALNIDYMAINCGSSFRGFHESILNHGGNKPEILNCVHEEQAVAMAHGYAKVSKKPMAVMFHGTVGIQHAAMAVYNAYADRVPVIVFAADHDHLDDRTSEVKWAHAAQDPLSPIRDYMKWDDYPKTLQHFAESSIRGYRLATTPPMAPIGISFGTTIQEQNIVEKNLNIPKVRKPSIPIGDLNAIDEAGKMLAEAENPVIVVDRYANSQGSVNNLIKLAELLQAPVVEQMGRMNFPNTHYLRQGAGVAAQADVILSLEVKDTWNIVNRTRDKPDLPYSKRTKPDVKIITLGMTEVIFRSNYQDMNRFFSADLSIIGDGDSSLPYLIESVSKYLTNSKKNQIKQKMITWTERFKSQKIRDIEAARYAWEASPISTGRLCLELWDLVKNKDWALLAPEKFHSRWPSRLWKIDKHYQLNGDSGGFGQGYTSPASVGAALAHKEFGRLPISIVGDGDSMYTPGVHWTSAHHQIPLLSIIHNNRGYHQELMHVQRMANWRQRGEPGSIDPGNVINKPNIDFAKVGEGLGIWTTGPITSPNQLRAALRKAIDVVENGEPALVDVITQPR